MMLEKRKRVGTYMDRHDINDHLEGGNLLSIRRSDACPQMTPSDVRKFDTGATRSADATRDDPEGYLSPIALDRLNEYMTKHRRQPDGSIRDSDNWQKGIPLPAYMKGLLRHVLHLWTRHRGFRGRDPMASANIEEDLCAIIFNAQGYLHEVLKRKKEQQ